VTVDRELVTRKMLLIMRDLDELREMLPENEGAFLRSLRDQAVVERYLERMIGRAIDINFHLFTESGHAPPADYYSSFTVLASLGVLDEAFARKIAAAAGLRNRLVHDYDEIDPARVFRALQSALDDIPAYLRSVRDYLDRLGGE
jgi:uncharacterized protein YutE (UPF0331/DUF86 family)